MLASDIANELAHVLAHAIAHAIGRWALAAGILPLTWAVAWAARALIKASTRERRWDFIRQAVLSSTTHLIYVFGLRLFVEFAPLGNRLALWADSGVFVLTVIVVSIVIRRVLLVGIEWTTSHANHSTVALQLGFIPLLRNVITLLVFLTGGITILKHFNYDVLSLLAALGVGSLAVGLAAKETLANMISGFILIIDRNLRPGDRINLGGSVGTVEEIGLRSTRILTPDGNTLIVPNAELVNTKILNLSMPSVETSCSTSFRVPYSVAFSKVKPVALSVTERILAIRRTPVPTVSLASVAEGFQLVTVNFWVSDLQQAAQAVSEFNEKLLVELGPMLATDLPSGETTV